MPPAASQTAVKPWTSIPALPGGAGWLGHSIAFGKDPIAFLSGGRRRAGDLFRFRLLGQPTVFGCGASVHEAVLKADDHVLNPGDAYPFMKPIFGPGIAFDAEPEKMALQMGYLAPHLGGAYLRRYPPAMEAEIECRTRRWGDEGEIELVPAVTEIVAAVMSRCLLGPEVHRALGRETVALFEDLAGGIRLAGLLSARLPLPAFRRRDRARRRLADEVQRAIDKRRHAPMASSHHDLLQSVLEARTPGGQPVPDDTVTGILIAAMFAGVHTSAALAAWAGVVLLDQAGSLKEVLEEQRRVMSSGSRLTAERLHGMEVMGHCIREAERLYPPDMIIMRKARSDFVLEGHHIPAGTLVMLSPAVAHRMESLFNDPARCDPTRYAAGREEHQRPYSLIAFSGGNHRCIGLGFAYQEIKAIWSFLLRHFDLELIGAPHRPVYSTTFVATPGSPCRLRYSRRNLPRL